MRYFTLGILLISMVPLISQNQGSSFIHFESDVHQLDAQSRIQISDLLLNLERHSDFSIQVVGHTDQDGSEAYNEILAQKRAIAVTDYMLGLGISENSIKQLSKGERALLRQESTQDAKQENRRVEIKYTYSDYTSLDELLADVGTADPVQSVSVAPEESQLIDLEGGTRVYIPKGAFVHKDGREVTGEVVVEVIEAHTLKDFMQHDLFTESNGELLETGGMLHIAATADGQPVDLAENRSLELIYPVQRIEEGMELFYGEATADGMNWTPSNQEFRTTQVMNDPVMIEMDSILNYDFGRLERANMEFPKMMARPRYPKKPFPPASAIYSNKKYEELYASYEKNLDAWKNGRPAYLEKEANWQKEVSRRLGIIGDFKQQQLEVEYRIMIARALRGLAQMEGRRAPAEKLRKLFGFIRKPMRIILDEKKMYTAAFDNYTREVIADRSIAFSPEGFWIKPDNKMCNDLKALVFDAERRLSEKRFQETGRIDRSSFGSYVTGISKLGWINCDAFRRGYDKGDLIVNKTNSSTRHYLVYKDLRSFIGGRSYVEGTKFNNIALRQPVKLIAVSLVDEKPMMAVQEFTTRADQVIDMELKPCSLDDITAELNSVDRQWVEQKNEPEILSYDLNLKVFPNPTAVSFTAVAEPAAELQEMAIFDMQGKMVRQLSAGREGVDAPVSVAEFDNGTYVVTAVFKNGRSTSEQLIVQNE